MLGWRVISKGEYKIPLHPLSEGEIKFLSKFVEFAKERVRNQEEIKEMLAVFAEDNGYFISKKQLEYLAKYANLHIFGFSALEYLLSDESIEEITMVSLNKPIFVYIKGRGWVKTNFLITSESFFLDLINKLVSPIGRRLTYSSPTLNAVLPNGDRIHASLPPISKCEFTIRKFHFRHLSFFDFLSANVVDIEILTFLSFLMHSSASFLIIGNTASGKTSFLNLLSTFIPSSDRIVIVEETPELDLFHQHVVKLVSNPELGINLHDLIYDTLRMRPDRVFIGEIRTKEEVNAYVESLLAGQGRGIYATYHANDIDEAIRRIRRQSGEEITPDYLLLLKRFIRYDAKAKRNREVRKVMKIVSSRYGEVISFSGRGWKKGRGFAKAYTDLLENIGVKRNEIEKRRKIIRKIGKLKDIEEAFVFYQREVFGNV